MITKAGWLALAAGLATGRAALAQGDSTLSWNNSAGGAASTTTNWAPNAMPGASDDLTFNLLASYAVTFSNLVPSAHTHTYKRGTVTLTMSSPHTVSSGIIVGDANTDVATAILTTGTWNSGGPITIGNLAGSNGTLSVNDDDADLIMTGTTSDMIVGSNAPGALSITGGGLVQVADQFIAGNNAAGTSTVTVSGATSVLPFVRSTLRVLGTGVSSKLGQGGDATVSISSGALADFDGDVVVSNGSASRSSVTLAGVGGVLAQSATLSVAGDLLLGRNTNAGAAAGVATMNVNGGGSLLVGGTLFVSGDPDGGSGTLHMANAGSITTTSLAIGTGSTLDLDGGTLDIDSGTLSFTNSGSQFTVGGVDDPVVTMINGASGNLAPTFVASTRSLVVGGGSGANLADFDVRSGSDLTISGGGDVILGDGADDDGSMIINGAGSTLTLQAGSDLVVGNAGSGHFQAELGGTTTGDRLFIASAAGSTVGAILESPGTTASFSAVHVGGSVSGARGQREPHRQRAGRAHVSSSISSTRRQLSVNPDGVVQARG
jgi:T5SS/PEP-CTERM-associated repeat protein